MCGIAGYYLRSEQKFTSEKIQALLYPIRKRGPDDEGVSLISTSKKTRQFYKTDHTTPSLAGRLPHIHDQSTLIEHNLALIHTRYAIIDLTERGHQPFVRNDQNCVAIFNGEIYNYIELREELSALGVRFKTSCDTEVLVEGYCVWGNKLWNKINGFWAVVLYDFDSGTIVLSRDRIGVAPLYYRETEEGLYFASCLESLVNIDRGHLSVNEDVVLGFIETGIKDHDHSTYYKQVKSVPSKTTVVLNAGQFSIKEAVSHEYWSFPKARLTPQDISFQEAVERYHTTFFNAVDLRLRSDVKVAFELSGGLDSSSIVAAAAVLCNNKITTYTAKIKDADEEPYARCILKKYLVDYHVIERAEGDFARDYENFSSLMEEPFDNPNAYTHHRMLQEMKKEGVHVVVTGAGGDEVLAGYEASFWPKAYQELKKDGLISYLRADWYEFCRRFKTMKRAQETLRHYAVDSLKIPGRLFGQKQKQAAEVFPTSAGNYQQGYDDLSFHEQALYHFNVALIPFYMRSSDHFTMGIPIEHRFPMLDYRMVELGLSLPVPYLLNGGWTKYILRKAMEPYLPPEITWRKTKMGFAFPYQKYLTVRRETFKPLLSSLNSAGVRMRDHGTYEYLLSTNPKLLWRLLSTAMWFACLNEEIGKS